MSEHSAAPLLTEVLTLSDAALVAFVDFVRVNDPKFTRDPAIIRRVFAAYVAADVPPTALADAAQEGGEGA